MVSCAAKYLLSFFNSNLRFSKFQSVAWMVIYTQYWVWKDLFKDLFKGLQILSIIYILGFINHLGWHIGPTHFRRVAARAQLADAECTELKERANKLWGSCDWLALAKRAACHHSWFEDLALLGAAHTIVSHIKATRKIYERRSESLQIINRGLRLAAMKRPISRKCRDGALALSPL